MGILRKIKDAKADRARALIKKARAFDNAPDFRNGMPTDAFKIRAASRDLKRKLKARVRKGKSLT